MKLLFCPECNDIKKMKYSKKTFCNCRKSWGMYTEDGLNAIIGGRTIPIGIDNHSFIKAIKNQPEEGLGYCFDAFVIPKNCPTINRLD